MATPVPTRARQSFGFSSQPFQGYFPSGPFVTTNGPPRKLSPYETALAGYNPLDEMFADQRAEAMVDMATGDYSSPQSVTGLQRLVGQGYIRPEQATAIARLGAYKARNSQAAQDALVDLYSFTGGPEQFGQLMRKHQSSGAFNDPRVMQAAGQVQGRILKNSAPPKLNATLQSGISAYNREITDEEKQAAFKKATGGQIKSDKDWNRAWHMVKDPRKNKLLSDLDAMELQGAVLPESVRQFRDQIRGSAVAPQTNAAAPQAATAGAQPTAPATQRRSFASESEALASGLPPGTIVIINGRKARLD